MDHGSPSFEANLLYKTAQSPCFDALLADLRAVIEINGETLHQLERIDSVFTLLSCERVQVLLAFSGERLPFERFLRAERPAAASLGGAEILGRLTDCRASGTVLVLDREPNEPNFDPAHEALKRTICWDVTDCIYNGTEADLVFWADAEMLYAAEEFERASSYLAHQDRADCLPHNHSGLPRVPAYFTREPVVTEEILSRISSARACFPALPGPECELADRTGIETLMSLALPNALALQLDRMTLKLDGHRAINGIAMACSSATIGLSGLPSLLG